MKFFLENYLKKKNFLKLFGINYIFYILFILKNFICSNKFDIYNKQCFFNNLFNIFMLFERRINILLILLDI